MALPSLFRNCSCAVPYSRRVFKTEWAELACAWETEAAGPFLWIWLEDRRARVRGQSAGCLLHPDLTHRSDCRTRLPSLNCHPVKTFECRLQQKHRARSYGHTKVDHSEPCPQGACEPAEWFCRFTIDASLWGPVGGAGETHGKSSRPGRIHFRYSRESQVALRPWSVRWAGMVPVAAGKALWPHCSWGWHPVLPRHQPPFPGRCCLPGPAWGHAVSLLRMNVWFWGQLLRNFQIM